MSEPTDQATEEATTEATEPNGEPTQSAETEQNGSPDEQPPIEEGEMADLDLGVDPEEVEQEAGAGSDDTDEQAGSDDESVSMADTEGGDARGSGYGEMYVTGLATTATVIKREKGDGGSADKELAYEIGLDRHFNEWLREQGLGEDMPPGQAVMIGTLMYLFAECATDEQLLEHAMGAVRE